MCTLLHFCVIVCLVTQIQCNEMEILDETKREKLQKNTTFCGNKLAQIMIEFCDVYYSPPEHRVKRQIVDECCHNPCSLSYILTFYCENSNRAALERFLNQPDEFNTQGDETRETHDTKHLPDVRNSIDTSHKKNFETTRSLRERDTEKSGEQTRKIGFHTKPRDKRNCACRKHMNKKSRRPKKELSNKNKLLRKIKSVPEPKIGVIEDSQVPFYIFRRYKR